MELRACPIVAAGTLMLLALCHPASAQTAIRQPRTFPITITKSGSYKLMTNLDVTKTTQVTAWYDRTAILVQADNVTIDLNGFSILGPTVCSGGPPVTGCTPTGTGIGIDSSSSGKTGTTVVNGTVQGMGSSGLLPGRRARVERVRAVSNGGDGIRVGYDSALASNAAVSNGGRGIMTALTSVITGNIVEGNRDIGINAGQGSVLRDNTARSNGADGIIADSSTVAGNVSIGNGGTGISDYIGGSVIAGNTARNNAADGIDASSYCTLIGNSAAVNGGYGISISGAPGMTGYGSNVMSDNGSGTVVGGVNMDHNVCNGSTTCP